MKTTLFIPFLMILVMTPAFGQLLSDKTGLVTRLDVESGGHTFEVETVSNFDVVDHEFNKNEKRLTLFVNSGIENNLGEVIVPQTLLSGNFAFFLNDEPYNPKIKSNDKISFITLNFTGIGNNKIDIIGTETLQGVEENSYPTPIDDTKNGGGCLIATATYGTELAPQVQHLREIRDQKLMQTDSGKYFINSFNHVYYSFSPLISDYERENSFFKESVRILITPLLSSLMILNYASMDNDVETIGVGIGIITLNVGMYFVAPAILITRLKK